MIFNSFIFLFVFFPVTFLVYWALKGKTARYVWLTVASYVFYGYWNWRFVFLMLAVTIIDFTLGLLIHRAQTPTRKKLLIAVSIVTNLGLLGFFKYFNFGLDTLRALTGAFGAEVALPALSIVLPVGISFYTFQSMSYTIDVYRGTLAPTKNFLEFACFVSLFPQLVAGPIVRFREIVDDLEHIETRAKSTLIAKGLNFFVVGLTKKVLIADSIAYFVNPLFDGAAALGTLGAWLAVLGYTYQLYFDFSGYSDMAVGLGYLFGFHFPQNFNSPYKAVNIADFWRRWHISLSSWLRDYLYIPLGGNRKGPARTYVNLFITMLLGGLWHGAQWTFVVWGAYHGALLALYKAFGKYWDALPRVAQRVGTFVLVIVGWVFFRSPTFRTAGTLLKKMFSVEIAPAGAASVSLIALIALAALIAHVRKNTFEIQWKLKPAYAVGFAAVFITSLIFMNYSQKVFLYYQF